MGKLHRPRNRPASDLAQLGVVDALVKRILITGSRDWDAPETIDRAIRDVITEWWIEAERGPFIIVDGTARGADTMAYQWTQKHQGMAAPIESERHPADWSRGKRAGRDRNELMVHLGADVCLAFIKNGSPGATHCAGYAEAHGIRTIRFVV